MLATPADHQQNARIGLTLAVGLKRAEGLGEFGGGSPGVGIDFEQEFRLGKPMVGQPQGLLAEVVHPGVGQEAGWATGARSTGSGTCESSRAGSVPSPRCGSRRAGTCPGRVRRRAPLHRGGRRGPSPERAAQVRRCVGGSGRSAPHRSVHPRTLQIRTGQRRGHSQCILLPSSASGCSEYRETGARMFTLGLIRLKSLRQTLWHDSRPGLARKVKYSIVR